MQIRSTESCCSLEAIIFCRFQNTVFKYLVSCLGDLSLTLRHKTKLNPFFMENLLGCYLLVFPISPLSPKPVDQQ